MADLLYAGVIEKITGEKWDEAFDFSGVIPESTTITYFTVTVKRADGVLSPDSYNADASSASSQTVTVSLNSLTSETSYIIDVSVKASDTTPAHLTKLLNVTAPGVYV